MPAIEKTFDQSDHDDVGRVAAMLQALQDACVVRIFALHRSQYWNWRMKRAQYRISHRQHPSLSYPCMMAFLSPSVNLVSDLATDTNCVQMSINGTTRWTLAVLW